MKIYFLLITLLASMVLIGETHAATRTALMKQSESFPENGVQLRSGDNTSPTANAFWFNTSSKAFKFYDGSVTVTASNGPNTKAVSAVDIDWSAGSVFTKTLGANTTFTFSNKTSGQAVVVRVTNTASNWTVTWPTVKWAGGAAPTQTVGAKDDVYTFVYDGTTVYGSAVQNLF